MTEPTPGRGRPRTPAETPPPATILVVDDSEENVKLLTAHLRSTGYEVIAAFDGDEALEQVARHRPNLILLDILLPTVSGFEVATRLKGDPETLSIPIIMITALEDSRTKIRGLETGADDFITKPFDKEELLARVRNLLRIHGLVTDLRKAKEEIEEWSRCLEERVEAKTRQLRESQSQLIQSEKMSALGQLISGVAHELNNPLTGIMGYSQLLQGADCSDQIKRDLRRINEDAQRCQKIIQNLLSFARKHRPEQKYLGVNGIIESALEILAYELRSDGVRVSASLLPDLPRTMLDFHQLQQVFLNILNNAYQSITSERRGGTIQVRTAHDPARNVILAMVADDGPGVPGEDLSRVFDPFFTTKDVGQGTGLGLSVSYGIVKEHGGEIRVSSPPGKGAEFTIELPILPPPADAEAMPEPTFAFPARQGRRILVVDDEAEIVELFYRVLRAENHWVDTAGSGERAMAKLEKNDYDLVIADFKMPGVNGEMLFDYICEKRPHLRDRVVFCTGDTINLATQDFFKRSGRPWIEKPFTVSQLTDAVRRHLA